MKQTSLGKSQVQNTRKKRTLTLPKANIPPENGDGETILSLWGTGYFQGLFNITWRKAHDQLKEAYFLQTLVSKDHLLPHVWLGLVEHQRNRRN